MALPRSLVLLLPVACCLLWAGVEGQTTLNFRIPSWLIKQRSYGASLISSHIVTDYGDLILADQKMDMIRMITLERPRRIETSVWISGSPSSLLLLLDGRIMVSFLNERKLVILRKSWAGLRVESTLMVSKAYDGLTHGPDGTVLASATGGSSGIDMLDLQGYVIRTVFYDTYGAYPSIHKLRRFGDQVIFNQLYGSGLNVLNIQTGAVSPYFAGLDLSSLGISEAQEMDFDHNGNLYVSVHSSYYCNMCLLQISSSGKVTALSRMRATTTSYPYAVTATRTQILVSWTDQATGSESEVTSYQLPY